MKEPNAFFFFGLSISSIGRYRESTVDEYDSEMLDARVPSP